PDWARRMASASVTGLVACREVNAFGALGRFRANGPIAAHPCHRMHRIPPGVVLPLVRIVRCTPRKGCLWPGMVSPGLRGRAGLLILPRLRPFVYDGSPVEEPWHRLCRYVGSR